MVLDSPLGGSWSKKTLSFWHVCDCNYWSFWSFILILQSIYTFIIYILTQNFGKFLHLLDNEELKNRIRNFEKRKKEIIFAQYGILFNQTWFLSSCVHLCIFTIHLVRFKPGSEKLGRMVEFYPSQVTVNIWSSFKAKVKRVYLRNIQLQRVYKENYYLTSIHVIMRSIDLQLWIIVSGGWY